MAALFLFCLCFKVKVGEGNGTPLQYSCLENPMDEGGWWAAVHGVAKSRTRLSDFTFTIFMPKYFIFIGVIANVPYADIVNT